MAENVVQGYFLNSSKMWIARTQSHDYGIDLEAELVDHDFPTGNIIKIQVKGTTQPIYKHGHIIFRIKRKYLDYANQFRVPVILLAVDITSMEIYFLWLQEYIYSNKLLEMNDSAKSILVKIPIQNKLVEKLDTALVNIATGRNDTSRAFAFSELVNLYSHTRDYETFSKILEFAKQAAPRSYEQVFSDTLSTLIKHSDAPALVWNEAGSIFYRICQQFGDQFTESKIIAMVARGESYSRAGLLGLSALYDHWPDIMSEMNIVDIFRDLNLPDVEWYCRFRKHYQGTNSLSLFQRTDLKTNFETSIGILYICTESFGDIRGSWPNRGCSAYLDLLCLQTPNAS